MRDSERVDERIAVSAALESLAGAGSRMKNVFTTGEVAEICGVSQQTIIRCIDKGRLPGYRVPGSKFRRVTRDNLIEFMRANKIPLEKLDSGKIRVLVVDDDAAIVEMLRDLLSRDGRFDVRSAANGFDAGAMTKDFQPDVLLLDYMLPDGNGVELGVEFRQVVNNMLVIVMTGTVLPPEEEALCEEHNFPVLRKPFLASDVMNQIRTRLIPTSGAVRA